MALQNDPRIDTFTDILKRESVLTVFPPDPVDEAP